MNTQALIKELEYKAIRSSGPGGQHVNKVSSKIVLSFNLGASTVLKEEEKDLLRKAIATRLTNDEVLMLACDVSRSQAANKEMVTERFLEIIKAGLIKPKKRKPTKPSKAAKKRRIEAKSKLSQKKGLRQKPGLE